MKNNNKTIIELILIALANMTCVISFSIVFTNFSGHASIIFVSQIIFVASFAYIYNYYRKVEGENIGINKTYALIYSLLILMACLAFILTTPVALVSELSISDNIWREVELDLIEIPYGKFIAFLLVTSALSLVILSIVSMFKKSNILLISGFIVNTLLYTVSAILIYLLIDGTETLGTSEVEIVSFETAWYVLITMIISSIIHLVLNVILYKVEE